MIKRLIAFLIAVIAVISCMLLANAFGTVPAEISAISTNNVLLYEANSDSVLFEKNGMKQAYPASTTKILTAIIVLDLCEGKCLLGDINTYFNSPAWYDPDFSNKNFSLDDEVTVTDPETRGSTMHIENGEILTVRD